MASSRDLRASNADRDRAVKKLRRHHDHGRLDADELSTRVNAVNSSRTQGDIAAVFSDLPVDNQGPQAERSDGMRRGWDRGTDWQVWFAGSLVSWAIWGATVITSDNHGTEGFWPIWVTVPWGAVVFADYVSQRRKA